MFKFGDIVVINFPFSNGQGSKRRPAVVLKDTADGDILIAKITSKIYNSQFDAKIKDWQLAGLLSESVIRVHKIQTIHSSLIFAHIGSLSHSDIKSTKRVIINLIMTL
jgi:mRNA interferase MazF